jgi:hypothetical protein
MLARVEQVLGRTVFSVGERAYTWRDVVDSAEHRGDWEAVSLRARAGRECARRADEEGDPLEPGELDRAAAAFRKQHDLLAAAETEEWLAAWGLDVAGWFEWVRRSLLRERRPAEAGDEDTRPTRQEEWTEAVCSGDLERLASALAERAAAHERFNDRPPDPGDTATMEAALGRLREAALTPEAVRREVTAHGLEWTRVDCRCVTAHDEHVARELALCVRDDGLELAGVARDAGLAVEERSWYLGDPEPIGQPLLGAQAGELVGPVAVDDGLLLCFVDERVRPDAEDSAVRERAAAQVARRAVDREIAARVRWRADQSVRAS